MKNFYLTLICLALVFPGIAGQGPHSGDDRLNVKDFGAKGDGVTDDTRAINQALQAAHDRHKDCYFPSGTYLCNTVDEGHHILSFDATNANKVNLYGDGESSKITTSLNQESILLYVYAYLPATNVSVMSLFFENTHQLIPYTTQGLFMQGTNRQNFSNVQLVGCRFEGFSTAVIGQGINGWIIRYNNFAAPRGHDCAKNDSEPAVFMWFADNATGYCRNIVINGNNADGYSGTAPVNTLVTRRAMDGFVYGTGYGFNITGNNTRNFSEEHYDLYPTSTFPNDTTHNYISGNNIDGTIPIGSMDSNNTRHVANYGIRCDISNATISQNTIRTFTWGIMLRGVDYPDAALHSYEISGNKLYAAEDTANYDVQAAIFIQGSSKHPTRDVRVINNDIYIGTVRRKDMYNGIVLYDMDRAIIQGNNVHISEPFTTAIPEHSLFFGRSSNVRQIGNRLWNGHIHKTLAIPNSGQNNSNKRAYKTEGGQLTEK